MKKKTLHTMNTSVYDYELDRYEDADDLEHFYHGLGIDGLELQLVATAPLPKKIPPSTRSSRV